MRMKFERTPMERVGVGDHMRGPRGPWRITKIDWQGKAGVVKLGMRDYTGVTQEIEVPTTIDLEVMSLLEVLAVEADERYTDTGL